MRILDSHFDLKQLTCSEPNLDGRRNFEHDHSVYSMSLLSLVRHFLSFYFRYFLISRPLALLSYKQKIKLK